MSSRAPVFILNQNAKREQGRKAQVANIKAARVSAPTFSATALPTLISILTLFSRLGCLRHRAHHPRPQVYA